MAPSGLRKFIDQLEKKGELRRIKSFVDPLLEITEFADRAISSNGPALLFENNGTPFPVLVNAFGSEKRISIALGKKDLNEIVKDFEKILVILSDTRPGITFNIKRLAILARLAKYMPVRTRKKGRCQQVINRNPDLNILPVLKCWPFDGGRFITLPIVHTINPLTGSPNAGMYRMQILDNRTTAMHWQLHKTGANHFRLWKETGKLMPVSVALGGNPVYTYAATAPLPENIDEYLLAGLLTKQKVKMVKCITNNIYVPEDADIVIEGYVDPAEPPVPEGPFGDHTGFYSLTDYYPKFHVTCITYAEDAVYPATIVGIPPKEDMFFTKATEKIFILPLKLSLTPEITAIHMPPAGVAHNLVIVSIKKSYPGQGLKVASSLFGAGQMMLSKYIIIVSDNADIYDYRKIAETVFENTDFKNDLIFLHGPLDVLDHSCDIPSFGGKMGIDATVKLPSEAPREKKINSEEIQKYLIALDELKENEIITGYKVLNGSASLPALIVAVKRMNGITDINKVVKNLKEKRAGEWFRLVLTVDEEVEISDYFMVTWQVLGNSDPLRDHYYIAESSVLIDGTTKAFKPGGFKRKWPQIVCADKETIRIVDEKWKESFNDIFVPSPSLKYIRLLKGHGDSV